MVACVMGDDFSFPVVSPRVGWMRLVRVWRTAVAVAAAVVALSCAT